MPRTQSGFAELKRLTVPTSNRDFNRSRFRMIAMGQGCRDLINWVETYKTAVDKQFAVEQLEAAVRSLRSTEVRKNG